MRLAVRRSGIAFTGMLLASALLAATPLAAAPDRMPPLSVRAPAITWSSSRYSIELEQQGVLAGRKLAVFVFVDGNLIARVETTGSVTRTTLEGLEIANGGHDLLVKAGTVEARARFRRLSALYPGLLLALLAVLVVGLEIRRRGHRSR